MARTQRSPSRDHARNLTAAEIEAHLAAAAARYQPSILASLDRVPDTIDTDCPRCGRTWARPLGHDLECASCTVDPLRDELVAAQERVEELDEALTDAVREEREAREAVDAAEFELRAADRRRAAAFALLDEVLELVPAEHPIAAEIRKLLEL